MAYIDQEKKKELAPAIKTIFKKYGIKGSIGINNHSTLVINIFSSPIDFISNHNENLSDECQRLGGCEAETYIQVNPLYVDRDYSETASNALQELVKAAYKGNHDNSDSMTDYFDVGWYVNINIGRWDRPYICTN